MKRDNPPKKSIFCNIGYVDYILLASSIAIALGDELTPNDLDILSAFFAVLADELALVSSVESACSSNSGDNSGDEFVPPAPPAAASSSRLAKNQHNCNHLKKRKRKVVKKRIKKK